MSSINTKEIINNIKSKNTNSVIYTEDYFITINSFHILLQNKIKELNIKSSNLISSADLDPKNGYKYLNGKKKISRDLALKLLISLQYSFDEIQEILKIYQYPILYPKIKRDHIIISSILNNYNIIKTNELLGLNNEILL